MHHFNYLQKSSFLRSSPIHLGYRGDDEQDPRMHQTVTFESCIFEDMTFYQNADATEQEDVAALINATFSSNTVVVKDCIFRHNRGRGRVRNALVVPCYSAFFLLAPLSFPFRPFRVSSRRLVPRFTSKTVVFTTMNCTVLAVPCFLRGNAPSRPVSRVRATMLTMRRVAV